MPLARARRSLSLREGWGSDPPERHINLKRKEKGKRKQKKISRGDDTEKQGAIHP